MKITSDKEYYKAKFELEELYEKQVPLPEEKPGIIRLTSGEQTKMKELYEATLEYQSEMDKEEEEVLTERYWIEVTERVDFVIDMTQTLLDHPCIAQTPDLKKKVEEAQNTLGEVYQVCGEKYD